jgi:hypothetical protein
VIVTLKEPWKNHIEYTGNLLERNIDTIRLSLKGRGINIPRSFVVEVRLPPAKYEEEADEDERTKFL